MEHSATAAGRRERAANWARGERELASFRASRRHYEGLTVRKGREEESGLTLFLIVMMDAELVEGRGDIGRGSGLPLKVHGTLGRSVSIHGG